MAVTVLPAGRSVIFAPLGAWRRRRPTLPVPVTVNVAPVAADVAALAVEEVAALLVVLIVSAGLETSAEVVTDDTADDGAGVPMISILAVGVGVAPPVAALELPPPQAARSIGKTKGTSTRRSRLPLTGLLLLTVSTRSPNAMPTPPTTTCTVSAPFFVPTS